MASWRENFKAVVAVAVRDVDKGRGRDGGRGVGCKAGHVLPLSLRGPQAAGSRRTNGRGYG